MPKPETYLRSRIKRALERERPGFWVVIHGSAMQQAGLPDLVGVYQGRFCGLEVKVPGQKPTTIQRHTLDAILLAGGIAGVVTSVEEALCLVPA